jgi:predicted O-linked N-acetylglucosamine transferase (SPINDLY family)
MLMNTLIPNKANPSEKTQVDGLVQLGFSLVQAGNFIEAKSIYEQVLRIKPNHFDALQLLGAISIQLKDFPQAVKYLAKAVKLNSNHPESHSNLSNAFNELKRFDEGLSSANKAINLRPNFVEAYINRGNALKGQKQFNKALAAYDKAIFLKPDYAQAHNNRGSILEELNRKDEAIKSYFKAVNLKLDFAEAYSNLGNVLFSLKDYEKALAAYDMSLNISADNADILNCKGNALHMLKRYEDALASYDQAIKLKPDFAEPFNNIGNTLQTLRLFDLAVDSYDVCIRLKSDHALAYSNLGNAFKELKKYDKALAAYDQAICIKPNFENVYNNRGNTYREMGLHVEACDSYEKLAELNPHYKYALGYLLTTKLALSDWKNWNSSLKFFLDTIKNNKNVSLPFSVLLLVDDPLLHKDVAISYINENHSNKKVSYEFHKKTPSDRLRLGFYSPDLHYHPVAIHLIHQLECFQKKKFELYAFSFSSHIKDPMRTRYENVFDHFIEVDGMSDSEIVSLSRELGIDIAFDMCGHTALNRIEIFNNRVAPIQVGYCGFPGTSGSRFIDYFIASTKSIPEDSLKFFTEKIVHIPSAATYDIERKIRPELLNRQIFGLPDEAFVFTCQNGNQKITPEVYDVWMDILKAVPKSVLWLQKPNPTAMKNLINEAAIRGISENRLIFTPREFVPIEQENERISRYLGSLTLADLFLDTWPYGAGTTGLDALYVGLPILTLAGKSPVSRMATNYLSGIHDRGLVANSVDEYRIMAVELAINPEKLKMAKEGIERNKFSSPAFNPKIFTQFFEEACTKMYERYAAGLLPDHIYIS